MIEILIEEINILLKNKVEFDKEALEIFSVDKVLDEKLELLKMFKEA